MLGTILMHELVAQPFPRVGRVLRASVRLQAAAPSGQGCPQERHRASAQLPAIVLVLFRQQGDVAGPVNPDLQFGESAVEEAAKVGLLLQ